MKKYFRVFIEFMKLSIQRFIEYRFDFVVWSIISTAWTIFSILFYEILFSQTTSIAGWSKPEVFVLVGTYLLIDSVTWSVFYLNMRRYVEVINTGALDVLLLQPLDIQFRLSTRHMSPNNFMRVVLGLYLLWKYVPANVQLWQIGLYLLFILLAMLVIYCLWFFSATFTFWAEKFDNIIEVVPVMRSIWFAPADVYSGLLSTLFTVIIPLALITTVPSRILIGHIRLPEVGIFLIFTLVRTDCFTRAKNRGN